MRILAIFEKIILICSNINKNICYLNFICIFLKKFGKKNQRHLFEIELKIT